MTGTGIFIALDEFGRWPKELREDVVSRVFGSQSLRSRDLTHESANEVIQTTNNSDIEDEYLAELSPKQARDLYQGCSDKTKKAIEVMASGSDRFFQVADVAAAVGVSASKLTGVWAGITRRTRTITQDPDVYLINWTGNEPIYDKDGNYADQRGELSELSYRALCKAIHRSKDIF